MRVEDRLLHQILQLFFLGFFLLLFFVFPLYLGFYFFLLLFQFVQVFVPLSPVQQTLSMDFLCPVYEVVLVFQAFLVPFVHLSHALVRQSLQNALFFSTESVQEFGAFEELLFVFVEELAEEVVFCREVASDLGSIEEAVNPVFVVVGGVLDYFVDF